MISNNELKRWRFLSKEIFFDHRIKFRYPLIVFTCNILFSTFILFIQFHPFLSQASILSPLRKTRSSFSPPIHRHFVFYVLIKSHKLEILFTLRYYYPIIGGMPGYKMSHPNFEQYNYPV